MILVKKHGPLFSEKFVYLVLTAIMAGAALAISGLFMQTLFRNPLAGPYVLGISSGASLGVALWTLFGFVTYSGGISGQPICAQ